MDFAGFKEAVQHHFNLNLNGYKERQLKRRLESLMALVGVSDYQAYFRLITTDEREKRRFLDRLTINVSEFFRNPEIFAVLEREVLPQLFGAKHPLQVWSAGCSNGCEAYSLAILLEEAQARGAGRVEATDVDDTILEVARRGEYRREAVANVTPERLRRFFTVQGEVYRVKDEVQKLVYFRHHDLLTEPYGRDYDLIVCRNVAIYFTREVQEEMHRKFYQALRPGGVLFIGATESILQYRDYGFSKLATWFYQKPAAKGE